MSHYFETAGTPAQVKVDWDRYLRGNQGLAYPVQVEIEHAIKRVSEPWQWENADQYGEATVYVKSTGHEEAGAFSHELTTRRFPRLKDQPDPPADPPAQT